MGAENSKQNQRGAFDGHEDADDDTSFHMRRSHMDTRVRDGRYSSNPRFNDGYNGEPARGPQNTNDIGAAAGSGSGPGLRVVVNMNMGGQGGAAQGGSQREVDAAPQARFRDRSLARYQAGPRAVYQAGYQPSAPTEKAVLLPNPVSNRNAGQRNDQLAEKINKHNDRLAEKINQRNDHLAEKINQRNDHLAEKINQQRNDQLAVKIDQRNYLLADKNYQRNDQLAVKNYQLNDQLAVKNYQLNDQLVDKNCQRNNQPVDKNYQRYDQQQTDKNYQRNDQQTDNNYQRNDQQADNNYQRNDQQADNKYKRKYLQADNNYQRNDQQADKIRQSNDQPADKINSKPKPNRQRKKKNAQGDSLEVGDSASPFGNEKIGNSVVALNDLLRKKFGFAGGPTLNLPFTNMDAKPFSGSNCLYVGNLPSDISRETVNNLMADFGEIRIDYHNTEKNYGFIRMKTREQAEAAQRRLNGYTFKGRTLKVRHNSTNICFKVLNLCPWVSNELLMQAFSVFGEVGQAKVFVKDNKPTGQGIVEFCDKKAAQIAFDACAQGFFLLTASSCPVLLEKFESDDQIKGNPEVLLNKDSPAFREARQVGPRFVAADSSEYACALLWKQLFDRRKEEQDQLDKKFKAEEQKLRTVMASLKNTASH